MNTRTPLVAGNWKMNGSRQFAKDLCRELVAGARELPGVELLVCPPMVYLETVGIALEGSSIALGAQNLSHYLEPGAVTGEVLASMLFDVGCRYVIIGHSERRSLHGEADELVARKTRAAAHFGLKPVVCVGETLAEREAGQTEVVLKRQMAAVLQECGAELLKDLVVAYEPVWAIGTGLTASPEQAQAAHALLRGEIAALDAKLANSTRILYGGSVKADNARALFAGADVDGGLIGGASLKAGDFLAIARAASEAAAGVVAAACP